MNNRPRWIPSGSHWIAGLSLFAIILSASVLILSRSSVFAQSVPAAPPQPQESPNRKVKFTIQPEYPELAKKNNITGTARVQALIAPDGSVKEVKILGGSPVLVQAAVDAVKKWRYEPGPATTTAVLKFDFKPGQ